MGLVHFELKDLIIFGFFVDIFFFLYLIRAFANPVDVFIAFFDNGNSNGFETMNDVILNTSILLT